MEHTCARHQLHLLALQYSERHLDGFALTLDASAFVEERISGIDNPI